MIIEKHERIELIIDDDRKYKTNDDEKYKKALFNP